MSEKHPVLAQIGLKWRTQGLSAMAPASEEEIDRFRRRYAVALPPSLLAYVRELNGMPANEHDQDFLRFWPLSEIQPVADAWPDDTKGAAYEGVFLFADWSIDAHGYGIRLDDMDRGAVVLVGADEPIPVAESFWSFLEMYLADSNSVFPGK